MPGRNDRLERQQIQEKGDNEAEASLEYIKHKADKRAGKENGKNYIYRTATEVINGEPTKVKQIKNKNDEVLAEIRYAERGNDFEIRMDNYGQEKGAARKALANLMEEYPNKEFYWEAINEQSVKSYNHFVEEYPELAERIRFMDNSPEARLDRTVKNYDNNSKQGVINETGNNSSSRERGYGQDISRENKAKNISDNEQNSEYDIFGIPQSTNHTGVQRISGSDDISGRVENPRLSDNSNKQKSSTYNERRNESEVGGTVERDRNSSTEQQLDTRPLADRQANVTSTQNAFNTNSNKNDTHITYRFCLSGYLFNYTPASSLSL